MRNWLRRLFANSSCRPHARSARKARPSLEGLEDRDLMSVTPHGGAILPHVEVQALYYGSNWNNDPASSWRTRGCAPSPLARWPEPTTSGT
jgi:hypothetical protein